VTVVGAVKRPAQNRAAVVKDDDDAPLKLTPEEEQKLAEEYELT
jgi:hypothetical protein